jgi:aspartate-semialdehyde dehydrogenase
MRAKSVGEVIDLNLKCDDCTDEKAVAPVRIDLTELKVIKPEGHTTKIKLFDNVGVILKYPSLETILKFETTNTSNIDQLFDERAGKTEYNKVYPHKIDLNVLPHIDVFLENGYTKEEMKMILETKKIMMDDSIAVTATTVRIPTIGGHSEAVNIEFENDFDLAEVRAILEAEEGIIVQDDPKNFVYPMPITAHGKDEVFVGRIRRDESQKNTLNLWIVADNLRKGAATNAVQIAEYLAKNNLI